MSQKAVGRGNIQVAVEHSQNVNITIGGSSPIELVVPPYPRPLPDKLREVDLLKAAYAQIPFVGRQLILKDYISWCLDGGNISIRTMIGQGGAGKTRFAYELYARIKVHIGWGAYFLRFLKDEAKGIDIFSHLPTTNGLIVVDYASDCARPLTHFLRSLTDSAPKDRKIRILLLARTASWDQGWLSGLASGRTGEDVDRYFEPRDPMRLPQFSTHERRVIFQQTVELAAKLTGKPVPPPPKIEAFSSIDVAERLSDPLTLMMAALVALHSDSVLALSLSRTDLAFEVAERLVVDRMKGAVDDHRELFLHLAAYATLIGGLDTNEALRTLKDESNATHLGPVSDPKAFLNALQAWLPGEKTKTWIGTIEPDIVGEAFIIGRGQRQQLYDAESAILRAAHQRPTSTIGTIIRIAQDFSFATAESRLEPLSWLEKIVERGEADDDLGLLFELSAAMPKSSLGLQNTGVHISSTICTRLRLLFNDSDAMHRLELQPLFANSLRILSGRQSDTGQREIALDTVKEAAALFRDLVAHVGNAAISGLALTLNDLANRQRDVGQSDKAVVTIQESIGLFRKLVVGNRDVFLPSLATALSNGAAVQSDLGKRDASLAAAEEAVSLRRELVGLNRQAFLPSLATALSNLSSAQAELGHRETAFANMQEATDIYRELAAHNPDAFLPFLSSMLNNIAGTQRATGQLQTALNTAREAAGLRRVLVARNREAYLPWLAMTLINLAGIERAMGLLPDSLASAQEAVVIYRELAAHNRLAYLKNFAASLHILSEAQHAIGQIEPALTSAQEAVDLHSELIKRDRDPFLPGLAKSLNSLGTVQRALGQFDAAIATKKEAVAISRELVAINRKAFLPQLGDSLHNLALMQDVRGLKEDALATATESVILHRELAASHRDAFLPSLADSLTSLANRHAALGHRESALQASREAMDIYDELVISNRDAFAQQFARTSGSFADALTKLDRATEALPVLAKAIRTILPSIKRTPAAYLDICRNLLHAYIETAKTAGVQHHDSLVQELVGIIEPYIPRRNRNESSPRT